MKHCDKKQQNIKKTIHRTEQDEEEGKKNRQRAEKC